jgi:hypothetical protein
MPTATTTPEIEANRERVDKLSIVGRLFVHRDTLNDILTSDNEEQNYTYDDYDVMQLYR